MSDTTLLRQKIAGLRGEFETKLAALVETPTVSMDPAAPEITFVKMPVLFAPMVALADRFTRPDKTEGVVSALMRIAHSKPPSP